MRVVARNYVAGIVFEKVNGNWKITKYAPILSWIVKKNYSFNKTKEILEKNAKVELIW